MKNKTQIGVKTMLSKISNRKIAIIGLGYVGLPLAVEFGRICHVIGYDINKSRIDELRVGIDSTLEVESEKLSKVINLEFSYDIKTLQSCDVYIVTVPTPIDSANRPDLRPLIKASETVGKVLSKGAVVIYESTVYPGCTEEVCVPVLEKMSGLKFNTDFSCGYSPERIVPGDKVHTLTSIKKITSGSNPETAQFIDELYASIVSAGTWRASSIRVAEAAKVIENSQRDLNIAFVNELSIIFDKLCIDTIEVLEAAGSKWNFLPFRPGLVGGHCIGVDPYYLTHKAEEVGYHPEVILGGRRINDSMASYIAKRMIKKMIANGIDVSQSTVGILGLTFKDNCPDIRNSKVVDLIEELREWGVKVVVSDPWANPAEVENEYGIKLATIDLNNKVDSLIVAVAHDQFKKLQPQWLRSVCIAKFPVLGDIKAIYNSDDMAAAGFSLFRL
jgi:UDP-N-acetyl-D-galactosamine dehydrogenase